MIPISLFAIPVQCDIAFLVVSASGNRYLVDLACGCLESDIAVILGRTVEELSVVAIGQLRQVAQNVAGEDSQGRVECAAERIESVQA